MSARARRKLTDAAIDHLRACAREYTVWDTHLPGLGVRVRPTGGKTWVMLEETDARTRRVSLGPVSTMTVGEARRACHGRRASTETAGSARTANAVPMFRKFVEGDWKEAQFERWKPATRKTYSHLLDTRLLPAFGAKRIDRITTAAVRCWFDDFSRTAPGNANNGLKLLRQIMNFAIARGHVETNSTRGIAPNRRPKMTRFLSREEIARLHRVLDLRTGEGSRPQAEIIRLLLLTGCRRGEIVRLRWSEVEDDRLILSDSKTGPRTVPLGSRARAVLARQPRSGSPYVFPSPLDPARPRGPELSLWYRVRRQAGIEDVRLHDLRHTLASHAVMNGVPVPVVARLLGHSSTRMTFRYAHLGDRDIKAAAERIGRSIAAVMGLCAQLHPPDASSGGPSG